MSYRNRLSEKEGTPDQPGEGGGRVPYDGPGLPITDPGEGR